MDSARRVPPDRPVQPQAHLNLDTVVAIVWESIWNALIRAFLIQILGSIAIGLLGDAFREMAPSLPSLGLKPDGQARSSPLMPGISSFVAQNHFWILFALLFVAITATRFARYSWNPKHRNLVALLLRTNRRIFRHWFGLFVINAFGAWISAVVIMALQRFSWTQIIWSWLGSAIQPLFHMLSAIIPGAGGFERWFSWYNQNQTKFLFWLLYSAAICDDLGLPNYKTLLRWSGRRIKRCFREHWQAVQTDSSKPSIHGGSLR